MAKRTRKKPEADPQMLWRYLAWAVLAGAWLFTAAALASYDPADKPGFHVSPYNDRVANWAGTFGAAIAHEAYLMLGPGVWVAMVSWLAALIATARKQTITQPILRFIGVILMTVSTSGIVAVGLERIGLVGWIDRPEGAGGLLAIYLTNELMMRFATLGTMMMFGMAFWVGAILAADQWVFALPRLIASAFGRIAERIHIPNPVLVGKLPALVAGFMPRRRRGGGRETDLDEPMQIPVRRGGRSTGRGAAVIDSIDEDAGGLGGTEAIEAIEPDGEEDEWDDAYEYEDADSEGDEVEASDEDDEIAADAPGAYIEQKKKFDPEALKEKIKNLPLNIGKPFDGNAAAPVREMDLSGYEFPGLDLLEDPETNFTEAMEAIVRDQALQLEQALNEYRIEGQVVGIDSGPAITLYEVRLAPGTKVSRITAVSSDLARAMRAQNIRIVPNIAGRDTIGIEVPNSKKEKVRLKELMTIGNDISANMKLPMFLGKDASGNPLIADMASAPHMLIAGTTGSGKSVCMNAIIMSFLYTKRPDELKLVLVDPKMVEMSQFKSIPHLMCPVVTEMSKAAAILEWAVTKMDERYELLAEVGVRDISSYNALGWEEIKERMDPATPEEEARIPKKLPYLVFIIDELADLMMTNKEVESFIVRIAQKARAVGIHMILATQRPQANVVTGLIKSNMPTRISFKVASGMDSRIVLDQKGAELLLGHGDMMYISPRSAEVVRAQGTLVDDFEIRRGVKALKKVAEQQFEPQLVQLKKPGMAEGNVERDPLFDDAVRVVLESQRGSVSLLQRRLSIGYGRASRLIEEIGEAGIIGEHKGSQAREVNMTLEEWELLQEQIAGESSTAGPASSIVAEATAHADAESSEASGSRTPSIAPPEEEVEYDEDEYEGEYDEVDEDAGDEEDEYEEEYEEDPEEVAEDDEEWEYEYEYEDEEEEDEET